MLSIRNRLHGVIEEIADGPPPVVEIKLDVGGEPLIARITKDAARALELSIDQPVVALIKATAFDRLDDLS
jgi:molybdate transport system ATP-binding protein